MRITTLIVLALLMLPVFAQAQDSLEDEYATHALRVRYSLWGNSIVQGVDDTKVAGMNWFASDVDILSAREDEIGVTFKAYRNKKNLSTTMYMLSMAALFSANESLSQPVWMYNSTLETRRR